ncbi:MAG TPA: SCP2 sterol-binding domain-containing protein [Acidimicrobiales bacterium]
MRYLGPEWMDAARQAVGDDGTLAAALAGVTLTVEQVVQGGPDGTVVWHIAVREGDVTLGPGPAEAPDLRFTTDHRTAAQIASGALAAQRAFVEGRLRVGGDLSLLITHQRALASVGDTLAGIRPATTYD